MIAVDTSALMAILLDEPEADGCMAAIEAADKLLISAGTVAEALIVAGRRNVGEDMAELIDGLGFEIVPVTSASAHRIATTYGRWGKGIHPAALNFGDCFAFDAAEERNCPLLYVGNDFTRTGIRPAL
ncbi:type II toxin-antitoxin system VapC family toxin [Amaricoccus sp.]|uniref:type II toxin-antitoxin system VapC family toxin n=1 Tax=Amaricoccus sp. TaxID=1872485 RepID=UPI001B7B8464|nr:type II toxin-antitoxin system VapC family toxin [Amaricoccus sp.]MBP7003149.1 type II toxin-antitoxin system VapC family toxin [Amaricoccus sp.]